MKKLYLNAILCLIILATQPSCTFLFEEVETNGSFKPKVALPLIETQYKLDYLMKGIVSNNALFLRPDGLFEWQYKGNFSEARGINVLWTLPDVIDIPADFDPIMITPFPTPAGMKIDYITFKKGKFQWTMTNNKADEALVTLTFYSLTKKDTVFEQTFSIQPGKTVTTDIDLKDWRLSSTASGKIAIGYKAIVNGIEERMSDVVYQFLGLYGQEVVGYFGTFPIGIKPEELRVNFFDNAIQSNTIRFTDPSLFVTIENSFGFPCSLKSPLAEMTNTDGTKNTMTSILTTGLNVNYPTLGEIGTMKQTVITLNKQNSNIADILNEKPKSLALALDVLSNPNVQNKQVGFTTDNSYVRFKMDLTMPFTPIVKDFVQFDTFDINLSDFQDVSDMEFKVITDNNLPLDLGVQAYFLAENTIIDSLVTGKEALIVKSAETFKGQVVGTTTTTSFINIDANKFKFIKNATRMIAKYTVSTVLKGTVPVQLKADQSFFMRIGVRVKT